MNTNDELSKARAELASAQERLARIEDQAKEQANKPWQPRGGEYIITLDAVVRNYPSNPTCGLAGSTYPTKEAAESALPYVTFFKRLCCLAAELNPSGKVGGEHYVVVSTLGYWLTNDTVGSTRDFWCLFQTEEAAQKAADILNRDSWKVSAL